MGAAPSLREGTLPLGPRGLTLGVLADTHIPDRARDLPPEVLEIFREAGVGAILHAGDVVQGRVLTALEAVAPVYAVRGNRDVYFLRHLPKRWLLRCGPVTIGMVHSHGTLKEYLEDKVIHLLRGAPFARFERRAQRAFPQAQVVVFGHIHYPVNRRVGAQWLFNPGSPVAPIFKDLPPTVGLLHIDPQGKVHAEIAPLRRG